MNYDDEKRELEEQVAGRVKNLRSMFEKGGNAKVGTADKKIARDAYYNKRVAEKEKRTKASYTQFKGALDSVENEALRRQRELRDAERKAEEDTLNSYRSVKSTKTLLDIAADEQKLREEQDRRMARQSREMYAKPVSAHDHVYTHAQKQREDELRAEREARDMLRNYSSGKSFFDEKLEEKRRKDDEERQKAAAICIQSSWKCHQARKELSSLRIAASEREAAEREAAEAKRQLMAASVIQSSWKCRQARKELSSLRIAASEREAAEREAAEAKPDSDDDDDDEASFVDAHEVLPEILKEEKDEVFIQDQSVYESSSSTAASSPPLSYDPSVDDIQEHDFSRKDSHSSSALSRSNSDEEESYEVVYSPTATEAKAKPASGRFGLFQTLSSTAAAAAPTGFAKRFGWKKSNDKPAPSSRKGFADDLPSLSNAA
ncbi:hypothetical protein P43SY_005722 [Pythium insidiosum]|uniref:Uncharacterized protein n=1 Tax=Pythium insidiosum TaxID=114742 RepID=A0AAD5QAT9_PYTIN|nr:hypothetical protein P43SY_005722 [Pythium insidiosum]